MVRWDSIYIILYHPERRFMLNPKRNSHFTLYKQNNWYPYYASYSDSFVADLIKDYNLSSSNLVVLDPWNGTGTTTFCCAMSGITSYGFDINPVMNIISNAKIYNPFDLDFKKLEKLLQNLEDIRYEFDQSDPLLTWYTKNTVIDIRKIERIFLAYENINYNNFTYWKNNHSYFSSNNINFLYLILFHILKKFSANFLGSNPTWIKSTNIIPVEIPIRTLISAVSELVTFFLNNYTPFSNISDPHIGLADSRNIPIQSSSIDLVISSPPYCTRIDYAIYTQLELSLLGFTKLDIRTLRGLLIGSPTIHRNHQNAKLNHLIYCNKILEKIESHSSKASKSYYLKTYKQYFVEMEKSIAELSRVLRVNGRAILVVQESWFKEIRIDLPRVILELSNKYHMCGNIKKYVVKQNIVNINTKSRIYKSKKKFYEAVVILEKRGE